jgi:hypothetical protein
MSCTISTIAAERRIVRADPVQHHVEPTLVALKRVLRLEHVEAKLARLSVIVLRGDEFEPMHWRQ